MAGGFRNFKSDKQRMKVMMLLEQRHGGGAGLAEHIKQKEETHLNQGTVNILVTKKRRMAVLEKLEKPSVVFSDDELQHITNSLNRLSHGGDENHDFALKAKSLIARHPNGVKIDEDFTLKGLEFLTRTNIQKQLGERERNIVDNFKEFHLTGWIDESNQFRNFFKPEFTVVANNGDQFDYSLGEDTRHIEITG